MDALVYNQQPIKPSVPAFSKRLSGIFPIFSVGLRLEPGMWLYKRSPKINRLAPRTPTKPKMRSDQVVSRNMVHLPNEYTVAAKPIDWITISEYFTK